MLSLRTLTPGSPKMPSDRPSVALAIAAFTASTLRPRSLATRGACSAAFFDADMRIETAAACGHGIPGNQSIGGKAVFRAIDLPRAALPRRSTSGRSVRGSSRWSLRRRSLGAGGGGSRVEIFRAGEILPEQFRADDPAILAFDETAVGLMRKEQLAGTEDDQLDRFRRESRRRRASRERSKDFFEEGFHVGE